MNLVKWLRKNNSKIMAIVVIVLMIGFIGGSSLRYILRGSGGLNKAAAYYGSNIKIRGYDVLQAQHEMDILRMLQSEKILQAFGVPIYKTPDFHALALGELLFSDQRPTPEIISHFEQTSARYQYRISNKEIDALYERTAPTYYYWYILDREAQSAGFKVPNETAQAILAEAMPQIIKQSYSQYIGNLMKNNVISEDQILTTFSKLLAILRYSHAVCAGQDLTIQQLRHTATWQEQSLGIEFVRFDSNDFIESQPNPSEEQLTGQLEKYKQSFPHEITEANPYGFGYKLPARVQLEYLFLKLDDIKKIVKKPTFDELESFYNSNKERAFTEQVKLDPNNPKSETESRTKPFSAVADDIAEYLLQKKINDKATSIIQEARTLADGTLQDINDTELEKRSIEERKKLTGDFAKVAEQLGLKNNIKIYHGQTGELSAEEMQTNKTLSSLFIEGYAGRIRLAQAVFAVERLSLSELGPYETIRPRVYLSLGPVMDSAGKIEAIVRVIKTEKESVPETINVSYSTKSIVIDPNQEKTDEKIFSLKKNVTTDLKRLAALNTAKSKADEFLALALADPNKEKGWTNAVEKFNELFGKAKTSDSNDPNSTAAVKLANQTFKLQDLPSLRKLSKETRYTMALQNAGNPALETVKSLYDKEAKFIDLLFSLASKDSNSTGFKPVVVEFKPDMSYYVIKNISVTPFWKENYERIKAISSFTEDHVETQSLALVHFNPANILKRMNFKYAENTGTIKRQKQEPIQVDMDNN
jgi:hypothetical protein